MKKKILIPIIVVLIVAFAICAMLLLNKKTYELKLPEVANISEVTLNFNNEPRTIKKAENISALFEKLNIANTITSKLNLEEEISEDSKLTISLNENENLTIFKTSEGYLLEQPDNGFYTLTEEEYNSITEFYTQLKQDLTEEETVYVNYMFDSFGMFLDQLGRNVKPEELTNDELVALGILMEKPGASNGFAYATPKSLNEKLSKFMNVPEITPVDMKCLCCDKAIVKYSASEENYPWTSTGSKRDYDYTEHTTSVYTEILEAYKIEDMYVIKTCKVFPDLLRNVKTADTLNFYATQNDATSMQNVLFTSSGSEEFAQKFNEYKVNPSNTYTYVFTGTELTGTNSNYYNFKPNGSRKVTSGRIKLDLKLQSYTIENN